MSDIHPLIRLSGVTKTFYNGELAVEVLHGIDLDIYPGEFVAIMGQSGSGKSTLMNILGCLDKPTSGRYDFAGQDVAQLSQDDLARLRREAFGFVFQSYNLLAGSTASENVEMPAVYSGMAPGQRQARAAELLSSLGLAERMHHRPSQLSGGQQQRVSIARALMNGGQIILADEPTGALDSHSGREVMRLLKELSTQGHTIILITHDAEVAQHAQRLIEIRDGRVIADPGPMPRHTQDKPVPLHGGESSFASDLREAAKTAWRSLHHNLFRTALTLLGIVIGVASVITMLAIGDGAKKSVVDSISSMGSNLLLVLPGGPNQRGRGDIATLIPEDVEAIRQLDHIAAALPEVNGSYTLRYSNLDHSTEVSATASGFPMARKWPLAEGTFFTEDDEKNYATVAVLGKTVATKLFGERSPLGEYLIINNVLFQVIGVMSERGADPGGRDQDDKVFVPYTTGSLRIIGTRSLRNITISVDGEDNIATVESQVKQLLLGRHGVEDFQIRSMASLIDTLSATQNTMTILLGSIAAISLLVGGIGVMNIMLVSVTERTREIGIRMATGARQVNILQQFLLEALAVSALGGIIGVLLGLGCAFVVSHFGMSVAYSLAPVVLAFTCAFGTGLVFGYLPARTAARLDPVAALATE
ncbi:MacB family efflux pump subunit [Cellvibrio japonicus]|uniref:Pyoverdine export ATP-binding/permease protein PvdT n=1 Tax=Cellvibrio japonicus (strain Ueda107) TaxID=498211 RepID=B3PL19_CELJU|nr:MacB family efflux pump subunit [Cellvibrio japonicus]ACE83421.1 macrolide ABC efflux protein [Cellvibrio japonicus Ueda107]QEI12911.1 MacB family efflux pump subunit [Cellvibrio japonicus]QEI16485.1 MacB family efflux pump subunit [Cellvibrio japonicus]QEI20063.1 MacB family efflux pump subunit [Cellvibrio japonicus]